MSDGAIKIELTAEDKASAVVNQAAREAELAAKRVEKTTQDYTNALKLERLQLEQGEEAAEAFRLQLQGLDEQTAKNLASERAAIAAQRQSIEARKNAANEADAASKKIEQAANKQRQETVRSTKASIEFAGVISSFAGGGAVGQIASQLAGLTEKTGQFAEVAKAGGAAALAMKAGLATAAVAAGAFAGNELRKWLDDVEGQLRRTERLLQDFDRLSQRGQAKLSQGLQDRTARLSIADDFEKATKAEIDQLGVEIDAKADELFKIKEEIQQLEKSQRLGSSEISGRSNFATLIDRYVTGDTDQAIKVQQALLRNAEAELDILKRSHQELNRSIGIEKELSEARKLADDSLRQSAAQEEQFFAVMEDRNARRLEAEAKLNEQSLQQSTAQEQQYAAVMADRKQREQRLQEIKDAELQKLQQEITLLEQGKEAAHAFQLEKQGLNKEDAAGIAAAQAKLDELNVLKNQNSLSLTQATQPSPELQAKESRLLTTGRDSTVDTQKEIAKLQQEQTKITEQSNKLLAEIKAVMQKISQAPGVRVEVVS